MENNLAVDIVIGDMDSVSKSALEYTKQNCQVIEIAEQNSNDLSKAIVYAENLQPESINIIGVDGGNSEHQLANYLTLIETKTHAKIYLDDCVVFVPAVHHL